MAISAAGRWSPRIGDPTLAGWVTVGAYAAAAVLCALCASRGHDDATDRRIWRVIAVLMLLLGVNKQLDLQSWFTQTGKDLALAQGWYDQRQWVQLSFIAGLVAAALLWQWWLYRVFRQRGAELRWAAVGLVFLAAFVVVRAGSFHHVDRALHLELGQLRLNAVLELGGIACIAVAAAALLARSVLRQTQDDRAASTSSVLRQQRQPFD